MVVQQVKDVGFVSQRWSALQRFEPMAPHDGVRSHHLTLALAHLAI